jgi:hypothetical protein
LRFVDTLLPRPPSLRLIVHQLPIIASAMVGGFVCLWANFCLVHSVIRPKRLALPSLQEMLMNALWPSAAPVRVRQWFVGALILALLVACGETQTEPLNPVAQSSSPPVSPASVATTANTDGRLALYRGPNAFPPDRWFEIHYDHTSWKVGAGEPYGPHLRHLQLPSCMLGLHGVFMNHYKEIGAIEEIKLAGRTWKVYNLSPGQVEALQFYAEPFMLSLGFFREQSAQEREACRSAAETVIDTFTPSEITTPFTSPLAIPDLPRSGNELPTHWPRFEGPYYSFLYPPSWSVEIGGINGYLTLYPYKNTEIRWYDKVEMVYLGYEISPEDDLLAWYTLYDSLAGFEPPERQVLEHRVEGQADGTVVRRLHLLNTRPYGRSQILLLTHGRLVLSFSTQGHDESTMDLLHVLADSIVFHVDAPTTQAELYPDRTDQVTTLAEVLATRQAPPPATPTTALFPPQPSDLPAPASPLPTPTAPESATQIIVPDAYTGALYYALTYSPQAWRLEEVEQFEQIFPELIHLTIDGCRLHLRDGARGQSPDTPVIQKMLAGRTWGVADMGANLVYTSAQLDKGIAFIIRAEVPSMLAGELQKPCQLAAEAVIDTFALVPPPQKSATTPMICQPIGPEFYRCHDYFLNMQFTYPAQWGQIETQFYSAGLDGNYYNYRFSQSYLMAGGRGKIIEPAGRGRMWTDFAGYQPEQLKEICQQYSAAYCEELQPGVLVMLQRADSAAICQVGAWAGGFLAFVAVNLPDHKQITGFVFPLPLYPTEIETELGWILSRAEPSTDCQDPARRAAFDRRVDELFAEFTNRATTNPDAWYAPVLQLAESIVIHP